MPRAPPPSRSQQQKIIRPEVENIIEETGFKKFTYQLDAVNQALSIIDEYNGVIIADVVGLGKSVIASLIAKNLGKRGMVVCPPGLIGDKTLSTGWWGYINDFRLYDWDVESRGKLEEIAKMIELMGARAVVAGLRPEIIVSLVTLNINPQSLITALNLESAFQLLKKLFSESIEEESEEDEENMDSELTDDNDEERI